MRSRHANPHLNSYRLFIPDLPLHGQSTSMSIPFDSPDAPALIADLVTEHAKKGKADLVGMSLGVYTAIYMAQNIRRSLEIVVCS